MAIARVPSVTINRSVFLDPRIAQQVAAVSGSSLSGLGGPGRLVTGPGVRRRVRSTSRQAADGTGVSSQSELSRWGLSGEGSPPRKAAPPNKLKERFSKSLHDLQH